MCIRDRYLAEHKGQLNTEVPISLNKEQKELLEKFRQIENEKSNPSIKKFFEKAKNFWKS